MKVRFVKTRAGFFILLKILRNLGEEDASIVEISLKRNADVMELKYNANTTAKSANKIREYLFLFVIGSILTQIFFN